jgi:hypothetical protein
MGASEEERLRAAIAAGGWLTSVQQRVVDDYQRSVGGSLAAIAVRLGFLTEEQVARAIASPPCVGVTPDVVVRQLAIKIPRKLALGYRVLPVLYEGETVLAAEDEAMEALILEDIWKALGMQLPVVRARPGSIEATVRAIVPPPPPPLPPITLEDLTRLLVHKGCITAADISAAVESGRGREWASAP